MAKHVEKSKGIEHIKQPERIRDIERTKRTEKLLRLIFPQQLAFSDFVSRKIDHWLVAHENDKELNEVLEMLFDSYCTISDSLLAARQCSGTLDLSEEASP